MSSMNFIKRKYPTIVDFKNTINTFKASAYALGFDCIPYTSDHLLLEDLVSLWLSGQDMNMEAKSFRAYMSKMKVGYLERENEIVDFLWNQYNQNINNSLQIQRIDPNLLCLYTVSWNVIGLYVVFVVEVPHARVAIYDA